MAYLNGFSDLNVNKYFNEINFDSLQKTYGFSTDNKTEALTQLEHLSLVDDKQCSSCGSANILEDHSDGNIVCTDCGQVLENILLDNKPEWKNYDDNDKNNGRCGMPINSLLPQSSLGQNTVSYGNSRLKVLQHWNSMPYKERSLSYVFKIIQDKCSKHNILKCIEDDAKIMYKMVSECKHNTGKNKDKFVITRGVNRVSIIAACVFYACRRKNMSRTPKEIALIFGLTYMEINKGCKNFIKLIKLKTFDMTMNICTAEQFVLRHCNNLNIKNNYIIIATQIAINIEKLKIASVHTPHSIAAASILLMGELHNLTSITKKKLASSFNISEVTIVKTYKKIEKDKNILCDNDKIHEIETSTNKTNSDFQIPSDILEKMKLFGIDFDPKINQDNKASTYTQTQTQNPIILDPMLKQILSSNIDVFLDLYPKYQNIRLSQISINNYIFEDLKNLF